MCMSLRHELQGSGSFHSTTVSKNSTGTSVILWLHKGKHRTVTVWALRQINTQRNFGI